MLFRDQKKKNYEYYDDLSTINHSYYMQRATDKTGVEWPAELLENNAVSAYLNHSHKNHLLCSYQLLRIERYGRYNSALTLELNTRWSATVYV